MAKNSCYLAGWHNLRLILLHYGQKGHIWVPSQRDILAFCHFFEKYDQSQFLLIDTLRLAFL